MPAKKSKSAARAPLRLVVSRVMRASPRALFAAWTEPSQLKKWSAPKGFTVPVATGDLKPGGPWRSCMVAPNGEKLWLGGVYKEVVPSKRLVFTTAWDEDDGPGVEMLVVVTFEKVDAKTTKMTLVQTGFASIKSRDAHRGGWNSCIDRLAKMSG